MNARQRFKAIVDFQSFDRLPLLEWAGWWDKTIVRWHSEGLPRELTDRYAICDHFGLDIYKQDWIRIRQPDCPRPAFHGGGVVETEKDYDHIRQFLYPSEPVDLRQWEQWAKEQQRGDVVLWFTFDGFFWFPRQLFGIERHLYAFYDQPDLMHRINADLAEWHLKAIEQVCSVCTPDFMTFAEDMSFNHGPMLSKPLFDEFMRPYYDTVVPALRKRGILPVVDSDGDVSVAAFWFEEAGLEGVLPLERQAGVDIAQLRADHPRMRFIGHFDKMVMHKGEDAIRKEFERLLPVASRGGLLISCDHQTPPGVSYEDYRLYIRLFREYAERVGELSAQYTAKAAETNS
ncbi:MAG TPA: hypothetical protein DCX07_07145 [Phycisphaerales bacterium]|nr:hypothetical protein [Phycisphaerales bacterium]